MPDNPKFLQTFDHERTAHVVFLSETGEKSHPIVERLFPLKSFASLPDDDQKALRIAAQMKLARSNLAEQDVPQHIRIVLPETVWQIIHWIGNCDGPIKAFEYFTRPLGNDYVQRAIVDCRLH